MDRYYCIVSLPEEPVADLCVLDAADDAGALEGGRTIAAGWPGWSQVRIYRGERQVGVLAPTAAGPLREAA